MKDIIELLEKARNACKTVYPTEYTELPKYIDQALTKLRESPTTISYEQIAEVISEITPYRNFTKDMFDGFQMAKASILIELKKSCQ